jgi:predicted lipoprotein with Yx(FWY)xxD motif
MKRLTLLLVTGLLAAGLLAAGCGDDDSSDSSSDAAAEQAAMKKEEAAMKREEAAMKKEEAAAAAMKDEGRSGTGTEITLGDSEFGSMLFDSEQQAIYIFENDSRNKTACFGECAAAWPPVYTSGKPQAGKGVNASLLGTIERRDGRLQVTYAGQPLYFYANEGPGEVKCHNVNLNGGFWWVVGPDGQRRA